MTVHRDREGEYICCGGRGGQEEGSCNKTMPTPKKTPVNFVKLSKYSVKSYVCDPSKVFTAKFNFILKPHSATQNMILIKCKQKCSLIGEYSSSQQLSSYCHFSLTAFRILSETS